MIYKINDGSLVDIKVGDLLLTIYGSIPAEFVTDDLVVRVPNQSLKVGYEISSLNPSLVYEVWRKV